MVPQVGFAMPPHLRITLIAADSPAALLDGGPTHTLIRQIPGAQFDKAMMSDGAVCWGCGKTIKETVKISLRPSQSEYSPPRGRSGARQSHRSGRYTLEGGLRAMHRLLHRTYVDVPALRPGTVGAYALAFVFAAVATALRLLLDPYFEGAPFITYFPAIIITAVISGFGAGLLCVVLSAAAVNFFVLQPRLSFYVENPVEAADLVLFTPLASLCVMLITQMRSVIEREQAVRAWRASKDRLQLALDTAQLGWWRYDPGRRVVTGDARFKEIYDVTADEIPLEDIKKLVHPDDSERFAADREAASDPANPRRSPHEYRVQRRDGEVRWVEVRWLAYFDDDQRERGAASAVGAVHDITERKQVQEREQLLMREINHRAKNMLSVVDAIAHQTATRTPEGFIERFSERIQALASNQDLLIRNAWHGVEADDLVRAQLAPFADHIGSRIVVRGPKLRLNLDPKVESYRDSKKCCCY
jgi:PAS domain S-box-containing protein